MRTYLAIFRRTTFLILLFLTSNIKAQCCYSDNYTTSAGWTVNGTGYTIGSGSFTFNATQCAAYNYASHPLNCTLSDNSWTGDFVFNYTGRGSVGVAHVLLSATAGTQNSWNTGGTSYSASNQDAVEAFINCPPYGAQNTDSIFGHAKDGSAWGTSSQGIPLSMGVTYYIRLERLSTGLGRISLFTNAAYTIHAPGSPQYFNVGCTITGLNNIQHGVIPQGNAGRTLTGTISGLNICDSSPSPLNCCYSDTYPVSSGWTMNGSSYTIGSGNFSFNATPGGAYNYATHPLSCTLSDEMWKGDVDFIYTARGSVGVAHTLLSATAGNQNSWNTTGSFAPSNQDAIEAYINCPPYGAQSTDSIFGRSKDGSTWNAQSVGIPLSMGTTYYVRVERLSQTQGRINLYTNSLRTIHAPGSPQYFPVTCNVTGLNTVQHGCIPQGAPSRTLTGSLANLRVCNSILTGMDDIIAFENINVFPNPNNGSFTISFQNRTSNNSVIITDVMGKFVYRKDKIENEEITVDLMQHSKGIYFIMLLSDNNVKAVKKIIVQ